MEERGLLEGRALGERMGGFQYGHDGSIPGVSRFIGVDDFALRLSEVVGELTMAEWAVLLCLRR